MITFDRDPDSYKHWTVEITNDKATLYLDVSEKDGIRPGYDLKLNSYDLGVDIELNDIVQRIRFEQPQVKVVVITSKQEKNFSAGANIYMLGMSEHTWKVNFCKFTNETRNSFEDSSNSGSIKFIAAVIKLFAVMPEQDLVPFIIEFSPRTHLCKSAEIAFSI